MRWRLQMENIFAYFNKQYKPRLLGIGGFFVLVIFCIDYLTGEEFSFSIFYLIAVFFVAWFAGKISGVIISILCAVAWLLADLLVSKPYSHPIFPVWNVVVMSSFFLLFTFVLMALKDALQRKKD